MLSFNFFGTNQHINIFFVDYTKVNSIKQVQLLNTFSTATVSNKFKKKKKSFLKFSILTKWKMRYK